MIFDLNKKIEMPDPKDALKGRDQSLTVSPKHYVNGEDVQGPYPNECKELKVAMGCFGALKNYFGNRTECIQPVLAIWAAIQKTQLTEKFVLETLVIPKPF